MPVAGPAPAPYTGRFAPSPTGPLHFGSLLTAVASYCDAHHYGGQWLVRIEDTDWQRNQPDAIRHILDTLDAFSLQPDQPVRIQSNHTEYYVQILAQLAGQQHIYGCQCSRKQLGNQLLYPGYCRDRNYPLEHNAIRLRVPSNLTVHFDDLRLGYQQETLAQSTGDFVLKRRDGILSYQLCVVADDALQGITHVVRGADLLDNTARQIYLQRCLGYATPHYLHLPLAMNASGQKLSKQNLARPLDLTRPVPVLKQALTALGQSVSSDQQPDRILAEAVERWSRAAIPGHIPGHFS